MIWTEANFFLFKRVRVEKRVKGVKLKSWEGGNPAFRVGHFFFSIPLEAEFVTFCWVWEIVRRWRPLPTENNFESGHFGGHWWPEGSTGRAKRKVNTSRQPQGCRHVLIS